MVEPEGPLSNVGVESRINGFRRSGLAGALVAGVNPELMRVVE